MIQAEHHSQRVDLGENSYIEATRDDTDDIQDCHYSVWKNGRKIHEGWLIYNIQYDYIRVRKWWHGKLYYDYLKSDETYGHLAEEFYHQPPEEGSPYPNNWEAVTPQGSDYFHQEGVSGAGPIVLECDVSFSIRFYIQKDIRNPCKLNLNLINSVEPLTPFDRHMVELDMQTYVKCTPQEWREERIKFLRRHSEYIGVEIPYDPRFID